MFLLIDINHTANCSGKTPNNKNADIIEDKKAITEKTLIKEMFNFSLTAFDILKLEDSLFKQSKSPLKKYIIPKTKYSNPRTKSILLCILKNLILLKFS